RQQRTQPREGRIQRRVHLRTGDPQHSRRQPEEDEADERDRRGSPTNAHSQRLGLSRRRKCSRHSGTLRCRRDGELSSSAYIGEDRMLRRASLAIVATLAIVALAAVPASTDSLGIGNVPQGTQSDTAYAASAAGVTNILVPKQPTSCYRQEVPYSTTLFPANGYDGMTTCRGADTGEDTGLGSPYPTQAGSNPNYPATEPNLEKDHSGSDTRH